MLKKRENCHYWDTWSPMSNLATIPALSTQIDNF
jgi:hypothetical protein